MGKELVGWKLPIASLLILGMARLTLSDVEEMRGDVREGNDKEDVPLEALKYLGRFGHLRPPEGPFSLVDRWVNNYNLSSRRPVLTLPITLSAYHSLSLYEQRMLGRGAENQNGNLRWHLPLGVRPPLPPPLMAQISRHFFTPLFFFCN